MSKIRCGKEQNKLQAKDGLIASAIGLKAKDSICGRSIPQLFEEQVKRTPDRVALIGDKCRLTYKELNDEANQLARYLIRSGVEVETPIGLFMARSVEKVIAVLGILKSGAAYVPMDPTNPEERLAYMMEDTRMRFLLASRRLQNQIPGGASQLIYLDEERGLIAKESSQALNVDLNPENLAYLVYTSGSTGRPKAVMLPHRVFMRCDYWAREIFQFTTEDRFLFKSVRAPEELFFPLFIGACVVVAAPDTERDPSSLIETIVKHRITAVNFSPAFLSVILNQPDLARCSSLKHVLCAGEDLPADIQNRFFSRLTANLYNFYGLAEAPFTTLWRCRPQSLQADVPIGRPVDAQVYVLNGNLESLPAGEVGELYIEGPGVARGYLNLPELTAEGFVTYPWSNGSRIYKTGDLGYYDEEKGFFVTGRSDLQVKIRGYRVELGDTEAALRQHPLVREAVVLLGDTPLTGPGLVAYLVLHSTESVTVQGFRSFLRDKLPEYAIPSHFLVIPTIPLTPTEKVDRKALEQMVGFEIPPGTSFGAPRNERERQLTNIWQEVLRRTELGIHDDFFDLGGHSLLAIQVIARIRAVLGLELPLRELFEEPTVAGLSLRLAEMQPVNRPRLLSIAHAKPFELSFAQERLWFLHQMDSDSSAYNIPEAYLLRGSLDVDALEGSVRAVLSRHEGLRTSFPVVDGRPVQVIARQAEVIFSTSDLFGLESHEKDGEIRRRMHNFFQASFNLASGPLLAVCLLRLESDRHLLLFNVHHIVFDDWSRPLFYNELSKFYSTFSSGAPLGVVALPIQYADFSIWQRQWLEGEEFERQLAFWRKQLTGAPALELPLDHSRPSRQGYKGAKHSFGISAQLTGRLKSFSRQESATPFMTLLGAFQVLLSRYSGQKEILVGTPIANRQRVELENLIGCFINMLVIRGDLSGEPGFREVVRRVRRVALDAYEHQELPFEKLVKELNPERDLSRHPLFQVMFGIQHGPAPALCISGLEVTHYPVPTNSTRFDLELEVCVEAESCTGTITYNTNLFDEATIKRMAGHYHVLLERMFADPECSVFDLPMLTAAEQHELLTEWNETAVDYGRENCIHDLFEKQVEKTPDAVAIVFNDQQLTYRELNMRANSLAHRLRDLGVGPETLVGICVDRSFDLVAGLLGIFKAGGAYVPIDPSYPKERIAFLQNDSAVSVLVTQKRWASLLPVAQISVVTLDDLPFTECENVTSGVNPQNLAYVIYTSGSTGRPKGVAIEHRNAFALVRWAHETFTSEALSAVLASTSICFDLSVFEIFAPLTCGGRVVLTQNILQLPASSAAEQVTLINTVPSAMAELVRAGGIPPSVITVNLAGEPLDASLVRAIYAQGFVRRVYDLYGPSEDTTYSTYALRRSDGVVTIGRPIANKQTYILDEKQQPVPIGVSGELYLGGAGVARGYLNRSELTAEKFVANPFSRNSNTRLYRTGDLCRYLSDGRIQFLGRMDQQIKLRGFRIELGEIEAVLLEHPLVTECAVVVREDDPADKRLVAYIAPVNRFAVPDTSQFRHFLAEKLPDYMVPVSFVILEKLPQTPNGKINRSALPVPERDAPRPEPSGVPRNAIERHLTKIWQEVLHVQPIGIRDNFFGLGGHSLLSVRLLGEIKRALGIQLPVAELFRAPTVEALATVIQASDGWKTQPPGLILPSRNGHRLPIFWAPSIGSVERFAECYNLGKLLEKVCSFYGFDSAPEFTDIRSLARHCIRLMRVERPCGPYAIVGFCHCGHVAYQIAQELESEGEKINLLALIDCSARAFAPNLRQRFYWVRDELRGKPDTVLRRIGSGLRRRVGRATRRRERENEAERETPFSAHARVAPTHKAKPFKGRVVLFRSTEISQSWRSPTFGWDALARVVEVHTVPCEHSSMLREPAVQFIADKIKWYLQQSDHPGPTLRKGETDQLDRRVLSKSELQS